MDIILLKNYEGLGSAGDIVSVKPGYARNKLIPEGIGLRASKKNLAISIEKKQIEKNRSVREVAAHEKIAKKLSNIEITIEAQVGEEEKMFGSITTIDIQKSLEAKGITVDRSSISLENPIKALGIYHVPIRVTSELSGDVKIYVIKS
ncbi:50S ribosomal protein L9 [Candidatus Marinimicrobia bacterium]|jgi:large subunit ribosomal protein L9|nr:50S ribosomal protein L9 [Candidatus Neomarinimicrobiota bacterium]|tara:strand:+ start:4099 stop:4542 length:444 start_codon:yes stop_codon:yes gene_type:complete